MLLRALLKPFGGPCTVSGSEVCPAEEHCLLGRIATDHLIMGVWSSSAAGVCSAPTLK